MGRHFLQIPGPTNCPDEVLAAIRQPTIDHRGPEFRAMACDLLESVKPVFGTNRPVVIYPSSGTGAWEAALVNSLSPGDRVLFFETGHFSILWRAMAERLGLVVEMVPGDWRSGVNPDDVSLRLEKDATHSIKAVCCVHNETSTGVASRIPDIRAAIDSVGHPALFLVDTISSLASMDYRHDEWGVDVTICGSQKGLMLPPGLGFNVIGDKALKALESATLPRSYWDWAPILEENKKGSWPYTPSTNMLYGLKVAVEMLMSEGLPNVFARHHRHAAATRSAVQAWGLEVLCSDPREYSSTLTAVVVPDGFDADKIRALILERFDMSLGTGLSRLAGSVFRIGHLGHFNDLTLAGTLSGVQMGLELSGVPLTGDGVSAALQVLMKSA